MKRILLATLSIAFAATLQAGLPKPFGIELGKKFEDSSLPVDYGPEVAYHFVDPENPIPEFQEYSVIVSKSTGRVVGLRAVGRFKKPYYPPAFAKVSEILNKTYGDPMMTKPRDRYDTLVYTWKEGQMRVRLESYDNHLMTLEFRVPH